MSFESVMPPYNASDPTATFVSSSCFDFLLIEVVPLAYRVANEVEASVLERHQALLLQQQQTQQQGQQGTTGAAPTHPPPPSQNGVSAAGGSQAGTAGTAPGGGGGAGTAGGGGGSTRGGAGGGRKMDEDEERDAVFFRLEMLGYRVGQGLVERFSRDRPRFSDTLDVIKFLCKDLWMLVFRKQVDNLKTNHRGVYVLTDNSFRPFSRMSTEAGGQAVIRAQPFLWFPCGIVRGALAAMGINATVQAETNELPSAVFQIKTIPAKT